MSKVDIFFICMLAFGGWAGYRRGIVSMVFTVVGIITGVWVISHYSADIKNITNILDTYGDYLYVAACVLVIATGLLAGKLASWFAGKVLKLVFLNWINKGIGSFVGLVAAWIFLGFMAYTGRRVPPEEPFISEKQAEGSYLFRPLEVTGSYLPGVSWMELYHRFMPLQQQFPAI